MYTSSSRGLHLEWDESLLSFLLPGCCLSIDMDKLGESRCCWLLQLILVVGFLWVRLRDKPSNQSPSKHCDFEALFVIIFA